MARTLLVPTDRSYWRKVAAAGVPPWDARNQMIAALIPPNSSVVDLGCGARTLQRYLKSGCTYRPYDVVRTDPAVILCNFNAGEYPPLTSPSDYVVCSGVLEYMRQPRAFLENAARMGRTIYLSYNPRTPGETTVSRLAKGWVSHLTRTELERIFSEVGLRLQLTARRTPTEILFELESLACRPL